MKRLGWLALGAAAVALLTGCGTTGSTGGGSGSAGDGLTVAVVFDEGGRGDKSFNDSAWRGLERAKDELGAEISSVESKSANDYETNLRAMADKGVDLVIAVGINQQAALEAVAPEYPDTRFAIVDGVVESDNVRQLLFKEEEGSFLVGYLAGLMTKTGKVGFVGGQELDLIKKFQYGFAAGAKAANSNVEILPAKYTGDWNNMDKARTAANVLFDSGADIVYHAAGRAGLGVIRAAKDKGLYAIGVDSDQDGEAPGNVLTSMIKKVDEAVFATVKDVKDGTFEGGVVVYDLNANGVGVSELSHTKDLIGADNLAKLAQVQERIASGELIVPVDEAGYQRFLLSL